MKRKRNDWHDTALIVCAMMVIPSIIITIASVARGAYLLGITAHIFFMACMLIIGITFPEKPYKPKKRRKKK